MILDNPDDVKVLLNEDRVAEAAADGGPLAEVIENLMKEVQVKDLNPFSTNSPCNSWFKDTPEHRRLKELKKYWKDNVIKNDQNLFYGYESFTSNLLERIMISVWLTDFIMGEILTIFPLYNEILKPNHTCYKCAMKAFLDSMDIKYGKIGKYKNPITYAIAEAIATTLAFAKNADSVDELKLFRGIFFATDFHSQNTCRYQPCLENKDPGTRLLCIKKPSNKYIAHVDDFVKIVGLHVGKSPKNVLFTFRNWPPIFEDEGLEDVLEARLGYQVVKVHQIFGRNQYVLQKVNIVGELLQDDPSPAPSPGNQRNTMVLPGGKSSKSFRDSFLKFIDKEDNKDVGEYKKPDRHFLLSDDQLSLLLHTWLKSAIEWKKRLAAEQVENAIQVAAYKMFVQLSGLDTEGEQVVKFKKIKKDYERRIGILHNQIFTAAGDNKTLKETAQLDPKKDIVAIKLSDLLFRETLCLVSEQVQHCPGRMNYLYHQLRDKVTSFETIKEGIKFLKDTQKKNKRWQKIETMKEILDDYCEIFKRRTATYVTSFARCPFESAVIKAIANNMDIVKTGIKEFKDNAINFDDLNDTGKWKKKDPVKTFREPYSLFALVVIVVKYIPEIITVKIWFIFFLYAILIRSDLEESSSTFIQQLVGVDFAMMTIFFVMSWLVRIISTTFMSPCGCNIYNYLKPHGNREGYFFLARILFEVVHFVAAFGYFVGKLFTSGEISLDNAKTIFEGMAIWYLPMRAFLIVIHTVLPMSPMTKTRITVPPVAKKRSETTSLSPTPPPPQPPTKEDKAIRNLSVKKEGCRGIFKRVFLRVCFVGLFFLITGFYEFYFVISKFTSLLKTYCGNREHDLWDMDNTQGLICDLSWLSLWVVTIAGLIIDNGLAFTLLMSMFGLVMGIQRQGESRGLVRVSKDELSKRIEKRFGQHYVSSMANQDDIREELFTKVWNWCLKYWRKQDLISNKEMQLLNEKVIDISKLRSPQAREIIGFWINSLSIEPVRQEQFEKIPKTTIIIPVYEEKLEFLWKDNPRGPYSAFDEARHLIAKYPYHWLNLQERLGEAASKKKHRFGPIPLKPTNLSFKMGETPPLLKSKLHFDSFETYKEYHIANWMSMHDQLVYRTVKGAASYFKSLTFLAQLELEELQGMKNRKEIAKRKAQEKIEIVLCFQTYQGHYDANHKIIHNWLKKWPFLKICYDYKRDTNLKPEMINNISPLYDFATVCLTWENKEDSEKPGLVHRTIPRENPLLLTNTAGERIQGKAMNQLNGLMFLTGDYLQVLDANQGGHATEYLKFPALLANFKVNEETGIPRRRIIGAREFIFTGALGRVANYHAFQEWSFGTLVLRVYSDLGIRLHYGHPDVFHAPWARGHSGLSKINPNINTSEDVFAGFETMMSKERTKHLEHIQFEKGRETGLQNMTGFDMKISAGNACLLRSRDLYHLTDRLPLLKRFLFFYGIAGHFLTNTMMVISMYWYIWAIFFFSLAGVSLQAIGGTIFATEWLLHAGFTTVIPLFAELLVERGPTLGFLEALLFVPVSTIVYLFQMQSKHAGFIHGMVTGASAHINTGRGLQIYRRSLVTLFTAYAHTHLYPMFEIITITVCYWSIASELHGGALPMIMIYVFVFCVFSAPQLFNPTLKGSRITDVIRDVVHFVSWVGKPSSLRTIKEWEDFIKEIPDNDSDYVRYSAVKDKESLPNDAKLARIFVIVHLIFSFGFWGAICVYILYAPIQYWLAFFLTGWFFYLVAYVIFSSLPFCFATVNSFLTPVSLLLLLAWGVAFIIELLIFSSNRIPPWTDIMIAFFMFVKLLGSFRSVILNFIIIAAYSKHKSSIEEKPKDKQQRNAFIIYFIVLTNNIFLVSSLRSIMALLWGFYSFLIGFLMRPLFANIFLFGRHTGLHNIVVSNDSGSPVVISPDEVELSLLKPLRDRLNKDGELLIDPLDGLVKHKK